MDTNIQKEFIIIEVNKQDDVEPLNLSKITQLLHRLGQSPKQYHDTVHILFNGYDYDPKEIFEIKAIRDWVEKLVFTYPDILYFLEEREKGLQNILLCIADFVSIKKIPGAILSSPLLDTNVYVQAQIPLERAKKILIQLTRNQVMNQHPSFIKAASERLLLLCH